MAAVSSQINDLDQENNLMWEEIKKMSQLIGESGVISLDDKKSFGTE